MKHLLFLWRGGRSERSWARWLVGAVLLFGIAAGANQVLQSGRVTPGHIATWTTSGVIQDGGTAADPKVRGGFGILSNSLESLCIDSADPSGPFSALCFGVAPDRSQITLRSAGGAPSLPFYFNINGLDIPFPGNTIGPFTPISDLPINVMQQGAACDGVTDDTAVFQRIATNVRSRPYGTTIYVPSGRCKLTGTLAFLLVQNQALKIVGDGQDLSELFWAADVDGITVTATGTHNSANRDSSTVAGTNFALRGVSLVRQSASTARTAIYINNNSDNNNGNTPPAVNIEDVSVHGSSLGGGWLIGMSFFRTATVNITNASLSAGYTQDGSGIPTYTRQGSGVLFDSTAGVYAADFHINNIRTTGFNYGIQGGGNYIQGLMINEMVSLGDNFGIYWNSIGFQDQLAVSNSHFNDWQYGIYTVYVINVSVTNSFFLNGLAGGQNGWTAIAMGETGMSTITGNSFQGANKALEWAVTITNNTAALGDPNWPSTITGNAIWNFGYAPFRFANNTKNVLVDGNATYSTNDLLTDGISLNPSPGPIFYGTNYLNGIAYTGSAPSVHTRATLMPRLYANGHIGVTGPTPTIFPGSCGVGAAMDNGSTDTLGGFTTGTAFTACLMNFAGQGNAGIWESAPFCIVTADDGIAFTRSYSLTLGKVTGLLMAFASASNRHFTYLCGQGSLP